MIVTDYNCDFISSNCPNPDYPQFKENKSVSLDRINSRWNKKQPIILVGHFLGGYVLIRIITECANDEWASTC